MESKVINHPGLQRSVLNFVPLQGTELDQRSEPFHRWLQSRRNLGVFPYWRILMTQASHTVSIANEFGRNPQECDNFGSQDYLGLAQHPAVKQVAKDSVDEFGVHSAGSPCLVGRTAYTIELSRQIAGLLQRQECVIYPTGWAAGFGVITGLVRNSDTVLIDALAHNCLQEGARHATERVFRFRHNSLDELATLLERERNKSADNGLFVVIESLYSMDSDSPNLKDLLSVARRWDAIVIADVAHDFGALGSDGLGLLETVPLKEGPDVIMGSFSKTFASNGGFVACSTPVRDYLSLHSAPLVFSNALSPIQTRVISKCFEIAFSEEGNSLRQSLMNNILLLRECMALEGLEVAGTPSPIVPVYVGGERTARLTARQLADMGLVANLVEFPAVAKGRARFRFQVMSTHRQEAIRRASKTLARARLAALEMLLPQPLPAAGVAGEFIPAVSAGLYPCNP